MDTTKPQISTKPFWTKVLRLLKIIKKGVVNKNVLVVGTIILSAFIVVSGSVLAYSLKIKQAGDIEYKNQNYVNALARYQEAKSFWFLDQLNFKFRDRDLETKISKANIMIKSGNNFKLGVDAFNNKNYSDANIYLSQLAEKDPHFQEGQQIVQDIRKLTQVTPTQIPQKPSNITFVPKQTLINCTGPDGKQFKTTDAECKKLNDAWGRVNTAPTSAQTQSSASGDSYRDQHCPKIIKLEDNIGSRGTFKKGDVKTITITITASDPQNLPLYYKYLVWGLSGGNNHTESEWSTNNSYPSIDVSNAPTNGSPFFITFYIDNRDGFSCQGGGVIDIQGEFNYTVTP